MVDQVPGPNVIDSDLLAGTSSFSLKLLINSFYQSFTGYIDDPDNESYRHTEEKNLQVED